MKKILLIFSLFVLSSVAFPAFSWFSTGHRLIAMIAYQNLNPVAKKQVDALTKRMFHAHYGDSRFNQAAVWPDMIKFNDIMAFNAWHFIDIPYVKDNIKPPVIEKHNAVWAVLQSEKVLSSDQSKARQKTVFLSFLVHIVGDLHEPMHCITLYSQQFPQGDAGGNLFLVHSFVAPNLHSYWDSGAGIFKLKQQSSRAHYYALKKLADQIMQQYPTTYFKDQVGDLNPEDWAKHSYQLAKQYGYADLQVGSVLTPEYVKMAQVVAKQQVALAGYRLAKILNQIFA